METRETQQFEIDLWNEQHAPDGETALTLLQNVYRDKTQPLSLRIRCAAEALPYEQPKLTAVATWRVNGDDFAERLERSIERSGVGQAQQIQGSSKRE
jgi:hypothetical protein